MAINLAKQASGKVAERFKLDSCTEGLFSSRYNWTGVASVQVYSIDNLPLQNFRITTLPRRLIPASAHSPSSAIPFRR